MPLSADHIRRVGVVFTGGTVGSEVTGGEGRGLVTLTASDTDSEVPLFGDQPDAACLELRVRRPVQLLSENLVPSDWMPIAAACRDLVDRDRVEGVVLLHGTDTMGYTSAALSFMLADLKVPVVITGSNLPPNQTGSDAGKNIQDSLVALRTFNRGVFVVFAGEPVADGWVHLGARVRKVRASGEAFHTVNGSPVAKVTGRTVSILRDVDNPTPLPHSVDKVDENVLTIRLYPGLNLEHLSRLVELGDYKAVVVELYASATANSTPGKWSLVEFTKRCTKRGTMVFTTVPAMADGPMNEYPSTRELQDAGATPLGGMITEVATVKAMWALAQDPFETTLSTTEIMEREIAGEDVY